MGLLLKFFVVMVKNNCFQITEKYQIVVIQL